MPNNPYLTIQHLSKEDQSALHKIGVKLDSLGCFPTAAFRIIAKNRHFQMFVPKERGGLGMDLPTASAIVEEYAYIEGNLGWIVQIGAGGGVFAAYMSDEIGRKYFSGEDQVIAGSDFVGGTARPVEGGYMISGSWNYASGSMHASAFTGNVRIMDGPYQGTVRAFIMPASQVDIRQTWNAMGMRSTDSHRFEVKDVFVPEDEFFSLSEENLQIPESPLFYIPFLAFARAVFVPVLSGTVCRYFDLYHEMMERKNVPAGSDAFHAGEILSQTISEYRNSFFDQVGFLWEKAESGEFPKKLADEFSSFCVHMTTHLLQKTENCHRHTGMEGIRMDSPINIVYRNIVTAAAHYLLHSNSL